MALFPPLSLGKQTLISLVYRYLIRKNITWLNACGGFGVRHLASKLNCQKITSSSDRIYIYYSTVSRFHLIREQFHVVTLINAEFVPYPQLQLKLMCEEFLNNQQNLTMTESVSIFCQCLPSALQYLHENNGHQSVIHQDVKSNNILLVQCRNSDYKIPRYY